MQLRKYEYDYDYEYNTRVLKFQRPMNVILKDVSNGKIITSEEKKLVEKYNISQRLKNKRK
jgi:hypothetical protein